LLREFGLGRVKKARGINTDTRISHQRGREREKGRRRQVLTKRKGKKKGVS